MLQLRQRGPIAHLDALQAVPAQRAGGEEAVAAAVAATGGGSTAAVGAASLTWTSAG